MYITEVNHISLVTAGVDAHAHAEEHEFHLLVDGRGWFVQNERSTALRPLRLFFSLPGDRHSIRIAPDGAPVNFYFVRFVMQPGDSDLLALLRRAFAGGRAVQAAPGAAAMFEEIRTRHLASDPWSRRSAQHRLLAFVCDLRRPGESAGALDEDSRVRQTVEILRSSVYRRVSLAEVAAAMGVSREHLVRRFRRRMGVPPMRYLLDLRLETARYLLRTTAEPVRSIAQRLCFYDEYHFSKLFKRQTGAPPSRYRMSESLAAARNRRTPANSPQKE